MDQENNKQLHVLVVGNDDNIFDPSSQVSRRVLSYAGTIGRLSILCRTRKILSGIPEVRGPITIYAIRSRVPAAFIFRTYILGRRIISSVSGPTLITADNPYEDGFVAWLLAKMSGLPLQLQIHTDVASSFFRHASWKERIRYWLARFLIPRADCVRVVSERIRNSIKGVRLPMVSVLPVYTDISKFRDAKRDPAVDERFKNYDFKMIAVGRFVDKEKNFSMPIDLMRNFVKTCPKALLVLVGDGPDRRNYELKIENYGLQKNVIIEPWRDDLPSFYKSFDLYLMSSSYEGWGRTVVEAMASGLPVVMTDVGLAGEVVKNGENGVVVPVGNRRAFLNALERMFSDKDWRARVGYLGRKTAVSISPKTQEEYSSLYRGALYRCLP